MQYCELSVGESVRIDQGRIVVKLVEKSGKKARLAITAPEAVWVERAGTELNSATKPRLTMPPMARGGER